MAWQQQVPRPNVLGTGIGLLATLGTSLLPYANQVARILGYHSAKSALKYEGVGYLRRKIKAYISQKNNSRQTMVLKRSSRMSRRRTYRRKRTYRRGKTTSRRRGRVMRRRTRRGYRRSTRRTIRKMLQTTTNTSDIDTSDYIFLRTGANKAGTVDANYGPDTNAYFCLDFMNPGYATAPSLDCGAAITFPSQSVGNTGYTGKNYYIKGITVRGSILRIVNPGYAPQNQYTVKLHLCCDRGGDLTTTSKNYKLSAVTFWEDMAPYMPSTVTGTTYSFVPNTRNMGRIKRNYKFLRTWVLSTPPTHTEMNGSFPVWNGTAIAQGAASYTAVNQQDYIRNVKMYIPINKKVIDPATNTFTYLGVSYPSCMLQYMKYFWLVEVVNPHCQTATPDPLYGFVIRMNARLHYTD